MTAEQARKQLDGLLVEAAIEDVQRERAEIGPVTSGTDAYRRMQALARHERHLRRLTKPTHQGARSYAGHCVTR